jgi:hypothetical protein
MRAIVLFQANHVRQFEFALQVAHVADLGAAESVDRLVVVAHREEAGAAAFRRDAAATGQQLQPGVLQAVGVLELVDQNVPEARLIVLAQRLVALQQFVRTQQQFGKVDHALRAGTALHTRRTARRDAGEVVVGFGLGGANPLLPCAH